MPDFHVVPGAVGRDILAAEPERVLDVVRTAYLLHDAGESVNPDSYFLRFPDRPDSRVIALPAYLGGEVDRIGLKWISSFPGNHAAGLPRASAVLILNDSRTGYPIACLEAATISAARTAASAAIAARALLRGTPDRLGVVGTGPIAATVIRYMATAGLTFATVDCHDLSPARAEAFAGRLGHGHVAVCDAATAIDRDVVLFATTATSPHVPAGWTPRSDQLVLHISLRDIAPETLLRVDNIVDDVEHCLKAQTSPDLAEELSGGRDFVTGTLGGVLRGEDNRSADRATVFSPFGLGLLDVAVGSFVLAEAQRRGGAVAIADFFGA